MLKSTIFREYDIRGIADSELPDDGVEQLGRALERSDHAGLQPTQMSAHGCSNNSL